MSEISSNGSEVKGGKQTATYLAVGALEMALGFCKVLKMGPVGTNLEGGLPEKQMEKVLWVSGVWGTWQDPPHPLRHFSFPPTALASSRHSLENTSPCPAFADLILCRKH